MLGRTNCTVCEYESINSSSHRSLFLCKASGSGGGHQPCRFVWLYPEPRVQAMTTRGQGPILLRSSTNSMNLVIDRILTWQIFNQRWDICSLSIFAVTLGELGSPLSSRTYMYELSLTSRMAIDELAVFKVLWSNLPKLDLFSSLPRK